MALLVLFTLLGSSLLVGTSQAPASTSVRRIKGTVVAYSPFARLTILVGPSRSSDTRKRFHEDFLVRIEERTDGLKKGQLVRLKYDDYTGVKPALPKNLFREKGHWIFLATSDNTCASNLETVLYYKVNGKIYSSMQLTPWAKSLKSGNPAIVPCYIISSGSFTKQ
jgi:hypothetical protein